MKFSLTACIIAFLAATASATVSHGGNNNEGSTSGILTNVLKSGILTGNDKNSESTIVDKGDDHGYDYYY
ncbi:hypothetical protein BJV82DRAFT_673722 [Fennellomyces sp. T-0311]|nr:hypothetical protein BJV82DRAFT_673722 [Fennellomyces sp. T-0311]